MHMCLSRVWDMYTQFTLYNYILVVANIHWWVGITDEATEGTWVWTATNETATFTGSCLSVFLSVRPCVRVSVRQPVCCMYISVCLLSVCMYVCRLFNKDLVTAGNRKHHRREVERVHRPRSAILVVKRTIQCITTAAVTAWYHLRIKG